MVGEAAEAAAEAGGERLGTHCGYMLLHGVAQVLTGNRSSSATSRELRERFEP